MLDRFSHKNLDMTLCLGLGVEGHTLGLPSQASARSQNGDPDPVKLEIVGSKLRFASASNQSGANSPLGRYAERNPHRIKSSLGHSFEDGKLFFGLTRSYYITL
jgi:hypothetical protein